MTALYPVDHPHSRQSDVKHSVLMVFDLDNLKPINDRYGHEGGDALLVQVADVLRNVFRATDLIVRWGGDEFVVLCEGADIEVASVLAERARASIAKQIFRMGGGQAARSSCSVGFAPIPFVAEKPLMVDWEQSLSIADAALYTAKRQRNTRVGWAGSAKAAQLESLMTSIAEDPAGLERDGYLVVKRRPWSAADTVEILRAAANHSSGDGSPA